MKSSKNKSRRKVVGHCNHGSDKKKSIGWTQQINQKTHYSSVFDVWLQTQFVSHGDVLQLFEEASEDFQQYTCGTYSLKINFFQQKPLNVCSS